LRCSSWDAPPDHDDNDDDDTSTTTTTLVDVVAPSVPGAPTATPAGCGSVQIAWTASTDAGSGVLGYDVRRNGVLLPRVTAPSTTMMDGGLAAQTTFAYTVTAVDRAGNVSGASAVASATTSTCSNQAPIAHAGPDVFTQSLTAVAFSGATSVDPDGTIVGYQWTFGDGASAAGVSSSHAYATAGIYTATLAVTDNGGLTATDSVGGERDEPGARRERRPGSERDGRSGPRLQRHRNGSRRHHRQLLVELRRRWNRHGRGELARLHGTRHVHRDAHRHGQRRRAGHRRRRGHHRRPLVASLRQPRGGSRAGRGGRSDGTRGRGGYFSGTIDFGTGPVTSEHLPWLEANDYKDVVVARYDVAGAPVWVRRVGAEADDRAYGVATDAAGNVAVTGSVSNYVDFGNGVVTGTGGSNDAFVAVYAAADGAHLWSRRFGDAGSETGYAVAVDGAGSVIVVGTFFGTVDFGTGPLTRRAGRPIRTSSSPSTRRPVRRSGRSGSARRPRSSTSTASRSMRPETCC
jgi:chitodextrinase